MAQTSSSMGVSLSPDWLKTLQPQPPKTPEKIWNIFSPEKMEALRQEVERQRQRRKERVLQEATPEELAKLPRARLVRALAKQKLVYTVREMAALSGLDIETIRRRVKDGTLRKVPSVRVIYVYCHNFHRWLQGEQRAT